jgi:enoyl-CoA hydratase
VWDSAADLQMMNRFVDVYQKLWYASKPTLAAVQGWCICGGTDLVLWADLIVAADNAVFGYPTSRVWGVPTTPMWIYRIGFQQAKRYLLTGDEISATKAVELGLVLESVPAAELDQHTHDLAARMAKLPLNQLQMIKLTCNQAAESMGIRSTRTLGVLFDGVARHTQEGMDFVALTNEVGFRQAVYQRDAPFDDYGSGPRSKRARVSSDDRDTGQ